MFGWFNKKVSVEEYKAKHDAVMAIFHKSHPNSQYTLEEIETMKDYIKFVDSASTWTGFDLKEERLLRRTIALILLAQNRG